MGKKRILFINGHLNVGGIERSLIDILRHFDYESYEVDLLLLESYGDYFLEIPSQVNVMMYPLADASGPLVQALYKQLSKGEFLLFTYRLLMLISTFVGNRVIKLLRPFFVNGNKRYDVVIGFRPDIATIFAAYLFHAKKRISWWHHGEMNIYGKQREYLIRAYNRMDVIVAVSKSSACMLKKVFPSIQNKVQVIPNMLCVEDILSKAKERNVMMKPTVCNIVSVGRMSSEKNMIFCIDIAKQLRECSFAFHWYLIGDGIELQNIRNNIEANDLSGCITLTGRLSNPYPYIQSADLLFHPSLVESQGLTILEAMALRTPVVVVESAGPTEFIVNGENGIIMEPCLDDTIQTIIGLYRNKPKMLQMCNEATETIAYYSPHEIMGLIYLLINKCLIVD